MNKLSKKKFFGFGFGPIQTGLFLLEAMRSGNFDGFAVAEIDQELVDRVRANGNAVTINVAGKDRIARVDLPNVELLNPLDIRDREAIAQRIREADEMATAVPHVGIYGQGGKASIASFLADNINSEKVQVLYAAENNIHAAEILRSEILKSAPAERLESFQILNTVIAKMSGVVEGAGEIGRLGLAALTPRMNRAVLVEEFNRILISKIELSNKEFVGFARGIEVFEEKEQLLPYEEVKFYGHNAVHAVLGYLAYHEDYEEMSQIGGDEGLFALGRQTLVEELGIPLIRKYDKLNDALFTHVGFEGYADDVLARIVNPHLHDRVMRICRDPLRKLGYDDRLFGAMRQALRYGVTPRCVARGVLAALRFVVLEGISRDLVGRDGGAIRTFLEKLWEKDPVDEYREDCIRLVIDESARGESGHRK